MQFFSTCPIAVFLSNGDFNISFSVSIISFCRGVSTFSCLSISVPVLIKSMLFSFVLYVVVPLKLAHIHSIERRNIAYTTKVKLFYRHPLAIIRSPRLTFARFPVKFTALFSTSATHIGMQLAQISRPRGITSLRKRSSGQSTQPKFIKGFYVVKTTMVNMV